jgi:hypothetical protein
MAYLWVQQELQLHPSRRCSARLRPAHVRPELGNDERSAGYRGVIDSKISSKPLPRDLLRRVHRTD